LIDVSGLDDVIPGSSALLFAGVAHADTAEDAALEQRIVSLLKLLAPDPQRPIVFIGSNRDDWRGLDAAAFRARKAGICPSGLVSARYCRVEVSLSRIAPSPTHCECGGQLRI